MIVYTVSHSTICGDDVRDFTSRAAAMYWAWVLIDNKIKHTMTFKYVDAPTQLDLPF